MRVAVIGGGISGIASAFYLLQRHAEVDLYESAEVIGGRAGSEQLFGRWVDIGGKNIGLHFRRFREFTKACGEDQFDYFGFNTSQLVDSRIISINKEGAKLLNMIKFIRLCGIQGIIKLYPHVKAVLDNRELGVLGSDYFRNLSESYDHLSLADFLDEHCIRHFVRAVTIRMNGAEPDECYPGNFGSNIAVALDNYEQLTLGMRSLLHSFRAMQSSAPLRLFENHLVTSVTGEQGSVCIGYLNQGKSGIAHYDKVISALPAHRLGALLDLTLPEAATLLRKVNYYPVAIAIVKYSSPVFENNRRAMVFDRSSPLSNAGAYGINDLDIVRYTFSGRSSREAITEHSSPEDVVGLGEHLSSPYFMLKGNQRKDFVYRYFKEGLCAYSSRHHRLLENIDRQLEHIPGFSATGDYRRGASVESCFLAAEECVNKVIQKQR
ncbi:MAG: NAD(P)-binding protein [Chlorobiaceae bacterium]|nr:NAD(P)-binding protein [Chlorobiaceae bacterium]